MKTKAVALYTKEDMRLEELELPPIESHDLVVRILACGVCGSDVRMFLNGPTPRYRIPIVLGHEFTAEVVETGPGVQGYAVGDRVIVAPLVPCMRCASCSRGQDNLCQEALLFGVHLPGAFAEKLHVPSQIVQAGGVVTLPKDADYRGAALTEILACCLHGLRQTEFELGDRVLIIGDGPVGLVFLQLTKLMGAGQVVTTGRRPQRRRLAAELGADEALDALAVDLKTYVREKKFEPDLVVIAASSVEATGEALEVVRPGGSVLCFSGYLPGSTLPLQLNDIHYREIHIHGSIDCTLRDFRNAADLLPKLQLSKLITSIFPLSQTVEAFRATKERDAVKVLVEP